MTWWYRTEVLPKAKPSDLSVNQLWHIFTMGEFIISYYHRRFDV